MAVLNCLLIYIQKLFFSHIKPIYGELQIGPKSILVDDICLFFFYFLHVCIYSYFFHIKYINEDGKKTILC
jgi:hypothetical protein